jgi:hypothetical protein
MANAEQDLFDRLQAATAKKPTVSTEGSPEESIVRAKGAPDSSKPVTLRNLFTHPDAHPVAIDFAMLKAFGLDWQRWEAETIWDEVAETFSTQLSELCRHKLRALQVVHTTTAPWRMWQAFEKVCQTFNGNIPDLKVMQIPALEELFAVVDMLDLLRKDVAWSDEVKLYMAAGVLDEDVFFVPPPLDFIQMEVAQPFYRCNDCGGEEPALFHDGFCSACTERLHPLQGLSLAPRQEAVNAGKGKNLATLVRYDPTPVAKRWAEVKDMKWADFTPAETVEDVQCNRLLLARDYMNIRRRQLTEQLVTLKSWLEMA